MRKSLLLICIILCIVSSTIAQKRVVCYWDSTSLRHENLKGYFSVEDIDPTVCTHIIYTYIRFLQSNIILEQNINDTIVAFINLKQKNPNVKLLIGVGGPNQPSQYFSLIASTETDRALSAAKVKEYIDNFGFDGVDLDWQYPNQGTGSTEADKENFVYLLMTWRQKLTNSKIFSISVGPRQRDISFSYNIAEIHQHVDFINLNTYNLRGSANDVVTAFHSPYRKKSGESGEESEWNAESIVDNWIVRGCPASKLTLGIATYGRSYTLSDISQTGIGAPVDSIGKVSSYFRTLTNNAGILPYAEICYNVKNNGWKETLDEEHFAFYAVFNDDQWVSYDAKESVIAKIHLARNKRLGGVNYASIDRDDFSNECGEGSFPLIRIGYDGIVDDNIEDNPIDLKTTLATTTLSTTRPGGITTTPRQITVETTSSTTTRPGGVTTTQKPSTTTTQSTTTTSVFSTPPTTSVSPTSTRTTTTRITSTTRKLPDELTPPLLTGPASTVTVTKIPDDEVKTTSSSGTKSTTVKRSSVSTLGTFPTPPTMSGLQGISSTTVDTAEIPTTRTSTLPSTTKTTTKKTTTTHFPTPPVTSFSIWQ
ncbi:hypothetical protein PVAND_004614 [Polypedilum vanderplanki]|uniref:GH18 domain-containing protein n=1 Tax=Polypedilum vanderplanki TaxID=319348 RepID=A0A9J6BYM9_POLVA|nr:hypothetical protein PVAND_004614 [Polypedilum vanderplanki]